MNPPPPALPHNAALFLDFDGTLAPLADRPDLVTADVSRNGRVRMAVDRVQGRLAVVSGRRVADLDRLLGGAAACLAGVHGLERRMPDGTIEIAADDRALDAARAAFRGLVAEYPALFFEDKGLGVALHFRQAPQLAMKIGEVAEALAEGGKLVVQHGIMLVEVRAAGPDKGGALEAFMAVRPFRGAVPVFVGDDLTDEAGFRAAHKLGGFGIRVGARPLVGALYDLESPADVLAWLEKGFA